MERIVTVIARIAGIATVTADRETIACDDAFSGVDALVAQAKLAGADLAPGGLMPATDPAG
jgi:hypothetical protein